MAITKLIQLPPGVYNVKASFTNFAAEEKTNLATIAAQNVQINFVLKPGGVNCGSCGRECCRHCPG